MYDQEYLSETNCNELLYASDKKQTCSKVFLALSVNCTNRG